MLHKQKVKQVLILALLTLSFAAVGSVTADRAVRSESPAYWSWEFEYGIVDNPIGTSQLARYDNAIHAHYHTPHISRGNAATLWFIVFNYPEACAAGPYQCSPHDLGNTAAQGDFLYADGQVIGSSTFFGSLMVGNTSGSGLAEMLGCQDCTSGLTNPEGALIILAIHDHGPAQSGQSLYDQISSYLGGCEGDFNGNEFGFAMGLEDIPDAFGECSTTQFSPHAP